MKPRPRSITLNEGPSGSTTERASAAITSADGAVPGAVRISITSFGRTDHEYYVTIPPEDTDWLLLNLLQEHWQSVHPTTEQLEGWLKARDVAYEDFGYWSGPTD